MLLDEGTIHTAADVEAAYRRGYLHGFSAGMDGGIRAVRSGRTSIQRLLNFFNGPLTAWRWARGDVTSPPKETEL